MPESTNSHFVLNEEQPKDLNALAKVVHQANIKWWQDVNTGEPIERNKFELLALAISEVSECLEGERKDLMDDKLPHRKMAEVELADAKIRLLDFAAGFGYNLKGVPFVPNISHNKGEALFKLMEIITKIPDTGSHLDEPTWIQIAIGYIHSYANKWGYDIKGAFNEKMAFNAQREDHKHEARRIAGGKQF